MSTAIYSMLPPSIAPVIILALLTTAILGVSLMIISLSQRGGKK